MQILCLIISFMIVSKRPIFVVSDSDSDDDLKVKSKRLKPSSPMTVQGWTAGHSDSDRENDVQKQLKAIVSSRKPDVSRLHAFPFAPSTAPNAQPSSSASPMLGELKPRLEQLAIGANSTVPDVKPGFAAAAAPLDVASTGSPAGSLMVNASAVSAAGTSAPKQSGQFLLTQDP